MSWFLWCLLVQVGMLVSLHPSSANWRFLSPRPYLGQEEELILLRRTRVRERSRFPAWSSIPETYPDPYSGQSEGLNIPDATCAACWKELILLMTCSWMRWLMSLPKFSLVLTSPSPTVENRVILLIYVGNINPSWALAKAPLERQRKAKNQKQRDGERERKAEIRN